MPYVKRDSSNNIVGIFNNPNDKATEYVEVLLYIKASPIFSRKRAAKNTKKKVLLLKQWL